MNKSDKTSEHLLKELEKSNKRIAELEKSEAKRKQAEEALRDSRYMLQTVLDSIPAGVFWKDRDSIYLGSNCTWLEKAGLKSSEEVVGKSDYDLPWDKKQADSFREDDRTVIESGIPKYDIIEPYLQADGTHAWAKTNKVPLRDTEGNVIGVLGTYEDITERKKAEDALRESDENLRAILDASPDVIHLLDINGIILSTNDGFAKRVGLEIDDVMDKCVFDYAPTESLHNRKAMIEKVFRTGEPLQLEDRGLTGIFESHIHPVFNPAGEVTAVAVYARDITRRKQAEEELFKSEEKHRTLFETMAQGVVYQDKDGKITSTNPAAERILGLTLDQMQGRKSIDPRWRAIHEDGSDFSGDTHPAMIALKTGKEVNNVKMGVFNTEMDEYRWININARLTLKSDEDDSLQVYTTFDDFTERKRADEQNRKFNKIIETISQSVIITNIKGEVLYVNPSYYAFSGFVEDEVIGKSMFRFAHKKGAIKLAKEVVPALIKKGHWRGDMTVVKKDKQIVSVDLICSLLSDKKNKPEFFVAIFSDITERKKAEEALDESERKYRSLFENSQNSITLHEIVLDKNGKPADFIFLEVNEAFELQAGLRKKDIIGKKATDVMPGIENDPVNWIQRYGEVVLTGKNCSFENYSEPLKKWRSVVAYKVGKNQFATIFADITDRKKSELEIQQSHTQLRKLAAHLEDVREEERTIIARNIHDELGQLATALKMDISWLQKQLPKEKQQWIAKTQTISDLIDMTSGEIQRICSELRPGVLDDLGLEDALEWYVSEYNKRAGTVCKLSIEYDLARLNKHLSVAVYRMIQEALTNVQRHAKASKVTISITGENGKLKLMIKDNGIGITQEKIDNPTSFGLIGIKERALSMNGYSGISGKVGEGTTLVIVLGIGNSSL